MMRRSNACKFLAVAPIVSVVLSGCVKGAPSFTLFGAYFPAWLFCAVFGVLAAIGARVAFITLGKSSILPFQLLVCTSIGLTFAFLSWLLWFGR
jgi:hypothetical protein